MFKWWHGWVGCVVIVLLAFINFLNENKNQQHLHHSTIIHALLPRPGVRSVEPPSFLPKCAHIDVCLQAWCMTGTTVLCRQLHCISHSNVHLQSFCLTQLWIVAIVHTIALTSANIDGQ